VAISVAATNSADVKADFSNYGPYVDVSAPGVSIYSTYSDHYVIATEWLQGTSMSAPFVTGLAALIKSHMPNYTKVEIDALIKDNTDYIDDVAGNESYAGGLGTGRINAYASLADLPVADFEAGPELLGPAPLEVTFTDVSPNSPTTWNWNFGDGYSDDAQHPIHTYQDYGLFTVALTVDEPRGNVTEVKKNLVMVIADTIHIDSVQIPTSEDDQQVVLSAYLSNRFQNKGMTVPLQIKKNGEVVDYNTVMLDSISKVGTRTDYFEYDNISPFDPFNNKYGITLISNASSGSEYLQPGQGTFMNLFITVKGNMADNGTVFTVENTTAIVSKTLKLESLYGPYVPVFITGKIFVQDILCGDVDLDGLINILDIVYLINYKYKGGPEPVHLWVADVNLDEDVNILDIVYLINYKYKGGPEPCNPPK
jgi:PKD repeat protein